MHRFEILFTLFLVAQPTFGTANIPGKPFRPQKYTDAKVARRDCVPAAPNVSASSIIADACRQNNQTDPTTCSDEITKFIQQSGASTCNLYSNLYNACKSSNNSSLTECSDSLLGYQECSNYTLQAYAYCGCYYSLPTQLSSCANEQLQNQTAGSVAVPMSSADIMLATRLVTESITPVGPAVLPPETPMLSSSQSALETNSTSWIATVSTMYLPIESLITGSSGSKSQEPNTTDAPPAPIPTDSTPTIITTLSILEPAFTAPLAKPLTITSHPTLSISPPPSPTPTISTLTLTLLSTITKSHHGKITTTATSVYLSTYTSTILSTISYTPTPSPSASTTITYEIPPSEKLETQTIFTTISVTQTKTIVTDLINEPIATVAAHTIVHSDTTSAVTVSSSGMVVSGNGAGAGNITAPPVGGGGCWRPSGACAMRGRGVGRGKRSRVLM